MEKTLAPKWRESGQLQLFGDVPMFCFDFESKGIESRPAYPPAPVGLATAGNYLAWGHPSGNNSAPAKAVALMKKHWHQDLLCHNAAFDIAIAHEKLGLLIPHGRQINDTMFLAFLLDPYGELGLKPLAERYLNIPPTERDAVRDWLYANKIVKKNVKRWGGFISDAPGELVGPYAIGDVRRTEELFAYLKPLVIEAGMLPAYERECDIMPMLLDNSAQGIPLDVKRLLRDTAHYEGVLQSVEGSLRLDWKKEIGSTPPANFDSGDELAQQLEANGKIKLPKTPTGKTSTAKDSLMAALPDGKVKGMLLYRSALEKCLSTYMRPWVTHGKALHANWNQVRNYDDDGARTGRLSSSPNMQNMTNPEKYDQLLAQMKQWKCGYSWATLPNLRSYIVPPKGMVLFSRDYSQQEFRLLAHYEDGVLAQRYRANPKEDMHDAVKGIIHDVTHTSMDRKFVKTINFGKVYGMGVPMMAARLGISVDEARTLVAAYDRALPSVKALMREVSAVGRSGEAITTLGGRRYFAPAPAIIDGDMRTFEYKLLNYLIQGGSADQTKQAMRAWWPHLAQSSNGTRFLLTVHDQLVGCCPKKDLKKESEKLDECMRDAFTLDVPTHTDPTYGTNFGEMKK
jgi:DNA polymerase-1